MMRASESTAQSSVPSLMVRLVCPASSSYQTSYSGLVGSNRIQGLTSSNTDVTAENTEHYLPVFSYLGTPHSGYDNPATNTPAPYPVLPPTRCSPTARDVGQLRLPASSEQQQTPALWWLPGSAARH